MVFWKMQEKPINDIKVRDALSSNSENTVSYISREYEKWGNVAYIKDSELWVGTLWPYSPCAGTQTL